MKKILDEMKQGLLDQLDEWLGIHVPEDGDEDYERWQSRLAEIEAIESFSDVYYYLGEDEERATEFFSQFGIDDFQSLI